MNKQARIAVNANSVNAGSIITIRGIANGGKESQYRIDSLGRLISRRNYFSSRGPKVERCKVQYAYVSHISGPVIAQQRDGKIDGWIR
jgi:hypothetical protein